MFFTPVQQLSQVSTATSRRGWGCRASVSCCATPTSVPEADRDVVEVPARLRGDVLLDDVAGFRYAGADQDALAG